MAGETTKTSAVTNAQAGIAQPARKHGARLKQGLDNYQYAAATSLEAADVLITAVEIPSNAIVTDISIINDDMDTHACAPTLTLDIGVSAAQDYKSKTSSTETSHNADDLIDADLFVDGDVTARAATTSWTSLAFDTGTMGADDVYKPVWELLGYDEDPKTTFRICVVSAAASAALGSAADFAIKVQYQAD